MPCLPVQMRHVPVQAPDAGVMRARGAGKLVRARGQQSGS